jgi:hypothetical protein
MALALIIAECSVGAFKDHILTFDSTPTLHHFQTQGLVSRVNEIRHLAQGTSTDFQAAYNLLLSKMKESGCMPGTEPKDIIVLTDMGWDQAQGYNESYNQGYNHISLINTLRERTHRGPLHPPYRLCRIISFVLVLKEAIPSNP